MRKPKIETAQNIIFGYFDSSPRKIFPTRELQKIFRDHRAEWNLSASMSFQSFLFFLLKSGKLRRHSFKSERQVPVLFSWNEVALYQLGASLFKGAYFSHFSAMEIHGLTDQILKTVYLNIEQTRKGLPNSELLQENIGRAFSNKPRASNFVISYDQYQITMLNGKNTGRLGVMGVDWAGQPNLPVTNLERTLIDIVVRPVYSGGVYEVLKAYQAAREKVQINRLMVYLKQLAYIYPYHQAVGFYLQRAGYPESGYNRLKEFGLKYDFYLDYNLLDKTYLPEWRLFVPKGF